MEPIKTWQERMSLEQTALILQYVYQSGMKKSDFIKAVNAFWQVKAHKGDKP